MAVLAQLVIVELRGRADVEALAERKLVRGAGAPRYQRTAPIGRCAAAELGGVDTALAVAIVLGDTDPTAPARAPTDDASMRPPHHLLSTLRVVGTTAGRIP